MHSRYAHGSHSGRRVHRGLSLVEACITLAIASVLVGTAAPSFDQLMRKRALDGIASELATDLRYARAEAVARNEAVRVGFRTVAGGTCVMLHSGNNSDCACDANGVAACSGGASLLKSTYYPSRGGILVLANVVSMRFDHVNGSVTPAGSIDVTAADGSTLRHVVNIMGRVRTCSPGGLVRDAKPC
ncbi:MAG TPA: GspH/FimT family pseudopilin [Burkholderiaceae bacterium]|nr:GspH/FimT family pseudopilin [Burkholderiaceae bacterium]